MSQNLTHLSEVMISATLSPLEIQREEETFEFVKTMYEWIIPLMIAILLMAIVGNGIIVCSAPFLSKPVSPYLRLCTSLAAADMWAASLLIAGLIFNSYLPVVMRVQKPICADAILEIFRVSGMLTSDWHLFGLAVNQFVGTRWPLKYRMIVTTSRVRIFMVALWLIPVIFTLGWFVAFENDGLRHPECHFAFYNRFPFRLTIFLIFVLPLVATLFIYAFILGNLLKAKAEFKNNRNENVACLKRTSRKSHVYSKLKLVWTTLLIVTTFSFSWGACVLYFILVCQEGCPFIYKESLSVYTGLFISSFVNFLVMIKLAVNPFIYTLRIKAIRKSVENLIEKIKFLNPFYTPEKKFYSRTSKVMLTSRPSTSASWREV